jgi:hypothetical protein
VRRATAAHRRKLARAGVTWIDHAPRAVEEVSMNASRSARSTDVHAARSRRRRPLRGAAALCAVLALAELAGCSTPASNVTLAGVPYRQNWEPGCVGPVSFCVPFFGP